MADFDLQQPRWVSAEYAKEMIGNAWIGQLAGASWVSRLIMSGTQSPHSHSMMFRRRAYNGNGATELDILELREAIGGRTKPYGYHLGQTGRIDIFAPNAGNRWPEFDPVGAVHAMRILTKYNYGYLGLIRMAARRTPLLWHLYPPTTSDKLPHESQHAGEPAPIRQPFCSHAVSWATDIGGGVDPVPRLPHWLVSPAHLTNSLFYEYRFSIVTPWALKYYGDHLAPLAKANENATE